MLQNIKLHSPEVIKDTGMKIWYLEEDMLENGCLVLLFCPDTTGKDRELYRLVNRTDHSVDVIVSGTPKKFTIPREGRFDYDSCCGAFVQTYPMIHCYDHEVIVRTGRFICKMDEEGCSWMNDAYEPICKDRTGLDYDGALLSGDHRHSCSWNRNPVVYVRDNIVIDSKGLMMLPQSRRYPYQTDYSLIAAVSSGSLCITAQRRVLCRGKLTLKKADPAMEIAECDYGYLVLTQCGDVYFSTNGRGWELIGDQACAMAAAGKTVAWADTDGAVSVYQSSERTLNCTGVLRFPGRYVTELDVSADLVALKFLDGSFDVLDWHTGKTQLGSRFLNPDLPQ